MALGAPTLNCPSCGAPVTPKHRFVKLAVCEFCQQTMHLTPEGADPTGQTATLTDLFSPLKVNARGRLGGKAFQVYGRLRFAYEDGCWDEWYVLFEDDGSDAWIHEDEGELTLLRKVEASAPIPAFDAVRAGTRMNLGGMAAVITERGSATIEGGEGQLPWAVRPGERIDYVDGNAGGKLVMVEYTSDGTELYVGDPVDEDDLEVEESFA